VEENATTASLLKASLSAIRRATVADLQAIGESGLQASAFPGIECLHDAGCFSGHAPSSLVSQNCYDFWLIKPVAFL
jgi:hypothetical protein